MGVVGTHNIDLLLMVTGRRAIAVSGMIDESPFVDCRNNPDSADFVAVNGETAIDDPGCYATVQMEGGLVVSVTAGNSLSGDASLRLYGTLGKAEVLGRGIVSSTFFGEVSSTGTITGEPVCQENSYSDD